MIEVSLVAAILAGMLALLSPCSALLLPSFFAYAFSSKTALVSRTFVFYVGLCLTLVPLGMGSASISHLIIGHRGTLITVAGWLIIVLGALYAFGGGFSIPFVQSLQNWTQARQGAGWLSTLSLGAVYGFAGFCSGPILGSILTVAATQESIWSGGILLATYALGMTVPLLILAGLWDTFDLGKKSWIRGKQFNIWRLQLHTTSFVSGLFFIVVGVVFVAFDGTAGLTGIFGINTTDFEFSIQENINTWASAVPAWILPVIVIVVMVWIIIKRLRSEPNNDKLDSKKVLTEKR